MTRVWPCITASSDALPRPAHLFHDVLGQLGKQFALGFHAEDFFVTSVAYDDDLSGYTLHKVNMNVLLRLIQTWIFYFCLKLISSGYLSNKISAGLSPHLSGSTNITWLGITLVTLQSVPNIEK